MIALVNGIDVAYDDVGGWVAARLWWMLDDLGHERVFVLDGGFPRILAKIAEEHGELAAELPAGERAAVVHEAVDLLFHVLVGLTARDIPTAELWRELERRFGTGGHQEKAAR